MAVLLGEPARFLGPAPEQLGRGSRALRGKAQLLVHTMGLGKHVPQAFLGDAQLLRLVARSLRLAPGDLGQLSGGLARSAPSLGDCPFRLGVAASSLRRARSPLASFHGASALLPASEAPTGRWVAAHAFVPSAALG
jgi:hypothetical protein